jgi:ElaB/YqjD/DUF883 family membrane-anchored ribosome-binding protein
MTATPSGTEGDPKSPDEIRQEIEETREELGDTVEALAAKTDVKAQVSDRVQEIRHEAAERIDKVKEAVPDAASEGAQQVADSVKRKPIPYSAGGAFAAGFLFGWVLGRR